MDFVVRGDVSAFELETPAFTPSQQQQIQLGTALRGVEIGLVLTVCEQRLFECEPFPASAVARVHGQFRHVFNPQQEVQDTAVAQVKPSGTSPSACPSSQTTAAGPES